MFRKILLVSFFAFSFLLSGIIVECFAKASDKLEQAKSNVTSLIKQGNYAQAQAKTQKLITSFPGHPALPEALLSIAQQYKLSDKNEKEAFDKLVAEFSKHRDLPDTLYQVARRYEWAAQYEEAKNAYYQQIKNGHRNSPHMNRAKLGVARTNILSLIMSQNNVQAKKDFDKLVVDFSGSPDLPDTLYWIARRYEWADNYEEAKVVYQQLMQSVSPDDPDWADRSKLGFERANILSLIISQNYDQAKDAYDKLLSEGLSDHSDFPATLYWIARRYEWGQKYNEAKNIYRKIIQDYPNSHYLSRSELGISRAEIASFFNSPDYEQVDAAFDKFITDFDGHPDLPESILATGEQCYKEGISKESAGLEVQARDRYEKAIQMWEKLINQYPDSSLVPEACCWAGDCYFEKLSKYEDSIRCFQKVADKYPKYRHAWHAQFMVGRSYEVLKKNGAVDKSVADEKIRAAYQRIKENYPDCSAAGYADSWLSNRVTSKKERQR